MNQLFEKIDKVKIVACCGSGGVGKTTLSAALGLHGVLTGKKTMVLTIDPSRRLADSLGISSFNYEAQPIPNQIFTDLGLSPKGSLYAMMLDTKRTFDRLIIRYTSSEQVKNRIFKNRYYQHLSTTLAGSHEYMAMEKIYEIYKENEYDLIIIDTPPSRNALDFLQAPQRLGNLFSDSVFRKAIRSSVKTGRFGLKMLAFFTSPFRMIFEKILGGQVLSDISDFFQLGDELFFEGFKERAVLIREVLSGPESLFLGIASPMYGPMKECLFLYDTLKEFQMPFGGFIINRVHPEFPDIQNLSLFTENSAIAGQSDSDQNLSEKLLKNYSDFKNLGESDASSIARLKKKVGKDIDVVTIPYFDQDVYDFAGLLRIYRYLAE